LIIAQQIAAAGGVIRRSCTVPATFIWFLFDWRGRIGRSAYRIALLVFALLVAAIGFSPIRADAFLIGMTALQLVTQAALDAKRLHDIGRSAWWIAWTNAACVAAGFALAMLAPEAIAVLREAMADTIGAAASASPVVCIVVAGAALGAALRSTWLWMPNSRPAGAIYDHDPRSVRALAASTEEGSSLDADALIAKALADQAAALAAVARDGKAPSKPNRKPFGRRAA
jgi:uncharacterized membrane protein YhaH (DUF805 family)